MPLGDRGSILGEVRTHFQTVTLTGLEFLSQELQRGYWTTDLSFGYQAAHDRWRLRPPRTYGARFSVNF
jgi:iron complex outermembrane receptor protein